MGTRARLCARLTSDLCGRGQCGATWGWHRVVWSSGPAGGRGPAGRVSEGVWALDWCWPGGAGEAARTARRAAAGREGLWVGPVWAGLRRAGARRAGAGRDPGAPESEAWEVPQLRPGQDARQRDRAEGREKGAQQGQVKGVEDGEVVTGKGSFGEGELPRIPQRRR